VATVRRHAAEFAPRALVVEADLAIHVDRPEAIAGRRVLVVEDGPTLTHGGMAYGAGWVAARTGGARELVDPRPFAVGSISEAFSRYPHIGSVLPALGYSAEQRSELVATIERSGADAVVDASPSRLDRFLSLAVPVIRVRYRFRQVSGPSLLDIAADAVTRTGRRP